MECNKMRSGRVRASFVASSSLSSWRHILKSRQVCCKIWGTGRSGRKYRYSDNRDSFQHRICKILPINEKRENVVVMSLSNEEKNGWATVDDESKDDSSKYDYWIWDDEPSSIEAEECQEAKVFSLEGFLAYVLVTVGCCK